MQIRMAFGAAMLLIALTQVGLPGHAQAPKPAEQMSAAMESLMSRMHAHQQSGDADQDFASLMAAHHQGVIDLAKVALAHSKDPELRDFARKIIESHEADVRFLYDWLIRQQADHHH